MLKGAALTCFSLLQEMQIFHFIPYRKWLREFPFSCLATSVLVGLFTTVTSTMSWDLLLSLFERCSVSQYLSTNCANCVLCSPPTPPLPHSPGAFLWSPFHLAIMTPIANGSVLIPALPVSVNITRNHMCLWVWGNKKRRELSVFCPQKQIFRAYLKGCCCAV